MTIEEIKKLTMEQVEARKAEIKVEAAKEDADLNALNKEVDALEARAKEINAAAEARKSLMARVNQGAGSVIEAGTNQPQASAEERAAQEFVQTGRMETRALLSTGQIAKPSKVGGINGLAEVASGIVDDVNAFSLTGSGAWVAAYKTTEATAAAVTDGSAVAGTASDYDYVTINPAEWGVLDEISKQVAKMTPLDYQQAIEASALVALRAYASNQIVKAILASKIAGSSALALDQDFLRSLVLGFRAIPGKGNTVLYIAQADLATLGKVRGTNEKKPLYDITFDAGTTTSGTIQEGGLAVKFRILDQLTAGTQIYGQPGAVDMPMWDNYAIETDEGGDYFKRNMIGIRGLQTANADLVAYHGLIVNKQSA